VSIIEQREKIYGDFEDIAETSQKIKDMFYSSLINDPDCAIKESFEMIAHKLSRIINGGYNYIDNWRDIAGYAQLVVKYLENQAEEAIDSEVFYKEKKNGQWGDYKNKL